MADPQAHTPLYGQPLPSLLARVQALRDQRARGEAQPQRLRRRIAVAGGYTTQFISRIVDLMLHTEGIDAEIWEVPYGGMVESVLNPDSELYAFEPEHILLLTHSANIDAFPAELDDEARVQELAEREAERWCQYAQRLASRLSAQIVQTNFALPTERALGNYEARVPYGRASFVRQVNATLARRLPAGVLLLDFEYLTARFGLERAFDARNQFLHKQPLSFAFLPVFCHALARSVALQCGLAKKCLVLDLDGTLWGGTVGEDGVHGLTLGPDSAEGEAFQAFQRYALSLRRRGVLLAVCSKNDDGNARAVFETHPHMLLKLEDVACFVANWQDKASNLVQIARTLSIGLDSLVFVDNSAEERHLVRSALPEVTVVELPEDPAEFVRAVDEGAFFEVAELTAEAGMRTESLRQNQERAQAEQAFVDYDAYLRSLELVARVSPLRPDGLARALELIKRTNQFNLRTVRHSEHEVQALLARPGGAGFSVAIEDRFGSYGTISVVLLERRDDALFVDTWLMSCRVLKKGVEQLVLEEIVAEARRQGVRRIVGEYRPTAKNGMVAKLYLELGFHGIEPDPEGGFARYALEVEAAAQKTPRHFIARHGVTTT